LLSRTLDVLLLRSKAIDMIILGIDPGLARIGFGVIRHIKAKKRLQCLDYGVIQTYPGSTDGERLKILFNAIDGLIRKHKPKYVAVEKLYFFKNLKTAIPVSQAKGVILLAIVKKKIPVFEFTPLQIKMIITGYGRADKKQVQEKVKKLLKLKQILKSDDAADALGIAICCARALDKKH